MIDQFMTQVAAFIETNHAWAGPLLALVTFGESLAFVGFLIPATALLLVAGTLLGSGVLMPAPILAWLIGGAILGDAVSFWIGRWAGPSLVRRWPLNRHRRGVARARLFFMRFGFASIFLGRFLGPVRSTIPLVAGMMRMRERPFQLANALSAVVWVFALLAPGYMVARGSVAAGLDQTEQIMAVGVMIVVLTVIGVFLGGKLLHAGAKGKKDKRRE